MCCLAIDEMFRHCNSQFRRVFFHIILIWKKNHQKSCYFTWFTDSFLNPVLNTSSKHFRKGEAWNTHKTKTVRKITWHLAIETHSLNMHHVICRVCLEIFIHFPQHRFYSCNLVYVLFFRSKNDLSVSVFDSFLMEVIAIVIAPSINIFLFCCL